MREQATPTSGIEAWREQLVLSILRVLLVAGTLIAIPSAGYAIATRQYAIVVVDVLAIAAAATLTFAPRLHHRTRAWGLIATAYLLGVWLLTSIGLVSQIYLMAVPVLAALLVGFRASIAALAVNAVTLTLAGMVDGFGDQLRVVGVTSRFEWGIITLNFLFVNAVLTISCAVLLRRLERALHDEQAAAVSLTAERSELQATNHQLAEEIGQRERAQAEAVRLAAAVTQAHDAIVIGDARGRITYTNRAVEPLRPAAAPVPAWSSLDELSGDPDQRLALRRAIAEGREIELTLTFAADDGGRREHDLRATPVRDGDGALVAFVAVLRDVTDERRTQARLRHAEKLEALGTLASGTAHDFNNILGSILAVAEHARARTNDPALREDLAAIVGACDRARDVVRQLVAFGAPSDAGRTSLDLRDVIETSLPLLRAALPPNVRFDVDLGTPGHVMARPAELEQVITNLVTNAAQAMGGQPDARIALTLAEDPTGAGSGPAPEGPTGTDGELGTTDDASTDTAGDLVLSVADNGPGIDPSLRARIFDPFFTTRGATGGSGLGLASVHGIVTSLGGHIDLDTTIGVGSTFHVHLPRIPARLGPTSDADDDRDDRADRATRAAARVLVVDDEELIRQLGAKALTRHGYEVRTAVDGADACRLLRADPQSFDLLITDLAMPGMTGDALIEQARDLRPDLPVILCSGHADTSGPLADDAAVVFLAKPYTVAELTTCVRRTLER